MVLYANWRDKEGASFEGRTVISSYSRNQFYSGAITFSSEESKLIVRRITRAEGNRDSKKGLVNKRVNISPLMENRFSTKNYKERVVLTR